MSAQLVDVAEAECLRLLERIKTLKHVYGIGREWSGGETWYAGSRETTAVRRASMDLTRALADLRRGI